MISETELQERCGALVRNEVHACVTALVERMLQHEPELLDELTGFYVKRCPAPDCGADIPHDAENDTENDDGELLWPCTSCETWVDIDDTDSEPREVYEWWAVSDWLADQLEKRGRVVHRDFYGLTVWGRCCTGQAIKLDSVIVDIYRYMRGPSIES